MRLWGVDPKTLCRSHLLGEHRELHAMAGMIRRAYYDSAMMASLLGHVQANNLRVTLIVARHTDLVEEMRRRAWPSGLSHETPLHFEDVPLTELMRAADVAAGQLPVEQNVLELRRRCMLCRTMQAMAESDL